MWFMQFIPEFLVAVCIVLILLGDVCGFWELESFLIGGVVLALIIFAISCFFSEDTPSDEQGGNTDVEYVYMEREPFNQIQGICSGNPFEITFMQSETLDSAIIYALNY